jgi:hypothetical protein
MAVLCLSALMSSSVGCALFKPASHVIGVERCPAMSDEAIASWGDIYHMANVDFKVWIGQVLLYCEKVEAKLD